MGLQKKRPRANSVAAFRSMERCPGNDVDGVGGFLQSLRFQFLQSASSFPGFVVQMVIRVPGTLSEKRALPPRLLVHEGNQRLGGYTST